MKIKIGIPRALLFYEYGPMWITFFNELGAEVIISPKTNKDILNKGTSAAVDDACIPVKLYHGHVINLKNKVDYLFIPRIMSVYQNEYVCPKFCGLPEMIKYSVTDMPKVINTKIDLRKKDNLFNAMFEIGSYVTDEKKKINRAYELALSKYDEYKEKQKKDFVIKENNIMLMGHPYILEDEYINMNIKKKLNSEGYNCLVPDMLDEELINEYASRYHGKIFWLFFRHMIGACLYLLENRLVDGIIYLSSFGCGIDSVVCETVERNIRRAGDIPFMLITIDEHSGEGGFNTRLEAFMDMLKWRKNDESHISAYGDYVYSR